MSKTKATLTAINREELKFYLSDLTIGDVFSSDKGKSWYLVTSGGINKSVKIYPDCLGTYIPQLFFMENKDDVEFIIADKVTITVCR